MGVDLLKLLKLLEVGNSGRLLFLSRLARPKPFERELSMRCCLSCCCSVDRREAAMRSLKVCFGVSICEGVVVGFLERTEPFLALFRETSPALSPLSMPRTTRAGEVCWG